MPSPLSFDSTKVFRDRLITRNLSPYKVPGAYSPPVQNTNYETVINDISVIDSPDILISDSPFSDLLYPTNTYGPEGGFDKEISYNNVIITNTPNSGPYDASDSKFSNGYEDAITKLNINPNLYLNPQILQGGPQSALYSVRPNPYVPVSMITGQKSQSYPNFNPSLTYSPYNILYNNNSIPLSQDSALQQIGAKILKKSFEETVGREIAQRTVNRINIGGVLTDPIEAAQVLSGNKPLIEGNYQITIPSNPVVAAADLGLRLSGTYYPDSLIPGNYFQADPRTQSTFGQISAAFNTGIKKLGGLIGLNLTSLNNNPSQTFINNTGGFTKRRLFYNLDFNKYKPAYSRGLVGDVINSIGNAIGSALGIEKVGTYYVGDENNDPGRVDSPVGSIPINPLGMPDPSPVYGPTELSNIYEDQSFPFGLGGKSSTDSGYVDGGFIWTSPKYKDNKGFHVKPGGSIGALDSEFNQISSSYEQNMSSDKTFKEGSILDKTQRLIDSQPKDSKRYGHAGNAIDQVSKVFFDGYREITKGSKVKSYVNSKGESIMNSKDTLRENEYCRIFAKDTPYYTYNDLQKKDKLFRSIDGLTTYSVLDSVYNLNIAPTETSMSQSSFRGRGLQDTSNVKKYMFSIENLAWRTSSRQGYRYSDLPACERGPNGGRIMWFPPYDIKFSESTSANWQGTTFLGRPEPVYTYKDSQRSGTLSFKIVVDHPSILNLMVNKVLDKAAPEAVNSIIDSFFAGCLKYDLYELAKIYNTIPPDELLYYQTILQSSPTNEIVQDVVTSIPAANTSTANSTEQTNVTNVDPNGELTKFNDLGFYFDNDVPKTAANFQNFYTTYTSSTNKDLYNQRASPTQKAPTQNFFSKAIINNFDVINGSSTKTGLRETIYKILNENKNGTLSFTLEGTTSDPADDAYNQSLSERRIQSVEDYLYATMPDGKSLKDEQFKNKISINKVPKGEKATVYPKAEGDVPSEINCDKELTGSDKKYSVSAMGCRAVKITALKFNPNGGQNTTPTPVTEPAKPEAVTTTVNRTIKRQITTKKREKDYRGFTKRVIRYLLNECDYFQMIQDENPFIFTSMKDKIKYFNPTFHSTTPEGLNSRLTFLQQCMRPGETIPTISPDGTLKNDDAYNTAFGAPPVLVLRIGDFFNTKVLCNSLSLAYEPLVFDMNPEGIGVQPMIANVSMNLYIIGGSGLKEPVEQLQNALSFNYYANTEIYDDRAEATEDTSAFDKNFYDQLKALEVTKATSQDKPAEGGDAIGVLKSSDGITGTINYKEIMSKFTKQTGDYFNIVINKTKSIVEQSNYGVLQLFTKSRNYNNGDFQEFNGIPFKSQIFGNSSEYQTLIDDSFDNLIKELKKSNNNCSVPFITELVDTNTKDSKVREVRKNLVQYLEGLKNEFTLPISNINQSLCETQQGLVQYVRKLNYVETKNDGKVKDGNPTVYSITATTPAVETKLIDDYKTIATNWNDFITEISGDDKIITNQFKGPDEFKVFETKVVLIKNSSGNQIGGLNVDFEYPYEKNFYLLLNKKIINKNDRENMITILLGSNKDDMDLKSLITSCLEAREKLYTQEKQKELEIFKTFEEKYKTYTPFNNGEDRIFNFTVNNSPSNDDKKRLLNIFKTVNVNQNKKTFNGKIKFN